MQDFLVLLGKILAVIVLIAAIILGLTNAIKDDGEAALSEHSKITTMLDEGNMVSGTTVKQMMRQAARQEGGPFVLGGNAGTGLTQTEGNGALDFQENGNFQTGKIYVIVNYLPNNTPTYAQLTDDALVKDKASFRVEKRFDTNGRMNRVVYTQVDLSQ